MLSSQVPDSVSYASKVDNSGFDFSNYPRNQMLQQKGVTVPKITKTGTTIVGLIYKDGVVIGADTRATAGEIVADKNCFKIHYLAPNIYCCGAGTAADCDKVTTMMSGTLELHRMMTGRESLVRTAVTRFQDYLFQYGGYIGAHLILGGVDSDGPQLCSVTNYGSSTYLPYMTMGSGFLGATSILETRYKFDMELQEAKEVVVSAVEAGIYHDLGSGSNVDVCIINRSGIKYLRNLVSKNGKVFENPERYSFQRGTTEVVDEKRFKLQNLQVSSGEPIEL